jgi:hypothetical protein
LDFANHTDAPNSDIKVAAASSAAAAAAAAGSSSEEQQQQQQQGGKSDENSSVSTSEGFVELVAVQDIAAGSEVTMSYSGPEGFTNQVRGG